MYSCKLKHIKQYLPILLALSFFPIFFTGCSFWSDSKSPEDIRSGTIIGIGAGRLTERDPYLGEAAQFKGRLMWPVRGAKLWSKFGRRVLRWHDGIDLAAPKGTPIFAAHSGRVAYSGSGFSGYGNLIAIEARGLTTIYAHNDRNVVKKGQWVEQGHLIGFVGRTGRVTGPHLHFETRIKRGSKAPIAVDPLLFWQKQGK